MNLFDTLTETVLANQPELSPLRIVVEKEIIHHDILREMNKAGFLKNLTFIGGTCLRDCYGSPRLSEDLDFSGGATFNRETLSDLGRLLEMKLREKYGLTVKVSEPVKETGNVDTWKIKIVTRPEQKHLPAQKVNIDICAVDSLDRQAAMIRNHYRVDLGTSGLILYAESKEEILADKIIALALRPNRIKNRDLWDILWLIQQNIPVNHSFTARKLDARQIARGDFLNTLMQRLMALESGFPDFLHEIRRFIPNELIVPSDNQIDYWNYLLSTIKDVCKQISPTEPRIPIIL